MKAGQEITSKSVNANIILNEQTRQANELLRQQRIAQVEEDLQAGVGAFTEDTEIINARRDKSGTIHENLKARLDAEKLISEQSAVSLSNQLADIITLKGLKTVEQDPSFDNAVIINNAIQSLSLSLIHI